MLIWLNVGSHMQLHINMRLVKCADTKTGSDAMIDLVRKVAAYDFQGIPSNLKLIASVPGLHKGSRVRKYGHYKLRQEILNLQLPESPNDALIAQVSSIGSMGDGKRSTKKERNSEMWLRPNLVQSMCGGYVFGQPNLSLIFPTVQNVRQSLEGYVAGCSLPYQKQNAEKQDFLFKLCHRWKADWCGRTEASPHIKTYCRWCPRSNTLRWVLLTSANLSQAAWGTEKESQVTGAKCLHLLNYELGVLFAPPEGRVLRTSAIRENVAESNAMFLPIPYDLPCKCGFTIHLQ
eukprot:m.153939 g.153939  ORF g.153939 m.153939 type:complete len:290 (+) comp15075_c0_seq5:782-1651(+)